MLTNIPNNTSARDWRDTVNALIKRVAALEAAGVPVETPAPAFTTQPSISPTSGTAGSTVYAATPGTVSNGSVVSRAWLLNGTAISTGVTALPASSGTLAYQETASGPGGTTTSTVQVAAVTAATVTPAPAPAFTSQPSISPNTGTAGPTTFTATAGNVSNGSVTSRSWTINGTVISTGITASPASSGTLTYQETGTGPGGTAQSTVQQVTVATAAAAAPAFTAQPTISPTAGTAGTTTYTATPGAVSNGTLTSRAWALNGSVISTALTAATASAGTLTYQEFATGNGGTAQSTVEQATVAVAASAGTTPIYVSFAGSSTPAKAVTEGTGYTSNSRASKTTNGTTFTGLGGVDAGAHGFTEALIAGLNRDVRIVARGGSGTTLAGLDADGSAQRAGTGNALLALLAAGVSPEDIYQYLQAGWNDAENGPRPASVASHVALIRSVISKLRAETGMPNLRILLGQSQRGYRIEQVMVRQAELIVANTDVNVRLGTSCYDNPVQSDMIHQTSESQFAIHGPRLAQQLIAWVQGTSQKRGPSIVSAAYFSPTAIDVTIQHGSGSDFTPTSGITGFDVSFDGGSTWATVSGARQSARVVRLTVADRGGVAALIRYLGTGLADVSGVLRDNTTPQPLPLDQGLANLTIAALQVVETPPPFSDTFTAADDTLLSAHTSDTGHTYSAEANRYRINSGTVSVPDTSGVARLTLIDRTFLKANQYVEADIFFSAGSLDASSLLLRGSGTEYFIAGFSVGSNRWIIGKVQNGTFAQYREVAFTPVIDTPYRLRFEAILNEDTTTTLSLLVNRAAVLTPFTTPAGLLTAPGKPGFRGFGTGGRVRWNIAIAGEI